METKGSCICTEGGVAVGMAWSWLWSWGKEGGHKATECFPYDAEFSWGKQTYHSVGDRCPEDISVANV